MTCLCLCAVCCMLYLCAVSVSVCSTLRADWCTLGADRCCDKTGGLQALSLDNVRVWLSTFPENDPRHSAGVLKLTEVEIGNVQLDNRMVDAVYEFPVMLVSKKVRASVLPVPILPSSLTPSLRIILPPPVPPTPPPPLPCCSKMMSKLPCASFFPRGPMLPPSSGHPPPARATFIGTRAGWQFAVVCCSVLAQCGAGCIL